MGKKENLADSNLRRRTGLRLDRGKAWQAGSCLLAVVAVQRSSLGLEGTEFSGGRLTGPLLHLCDAGSLLLVVALLLTFVYPRVAAALGLGVPLLCLPLYFFLIAPGPFRRVFRGEYSVPLQTNFVWGKWPILGVLTLAFAASVCVWNLATLSRERKECE
jgi:hypothetical protein